MEKGHRFVVEWLRSFEAKRLAVRLAYRAMPAHRRPNRSELDAIAEQLDPWKGSDEVAYVRNKRRSTNPTIIALRLDFGIENRALQYLLLLVLRERMELHPNQYGNRGGVHPAIKRVVDAMSEGYPCASNSTLKTFFELRREKGN